MLKTPQMTSVFLSLGRQVWPVGLVALVGGSFLFSVLTAAAILVESTVVPSLPTLLWMLLLSVPVSWTIVFPISACFAVALGLERWRIEGGWLAFQVSGGAGRRLLPGLISRALVVVLVTGVMGMWLEPWCRDLSREAYFESVSTMVLIPGKTVQLGERHIQAGAVENGWHKGIMIKGRDGVGFARRGRVVRIGDGIGLELEEGSLVSLKGEGWRLQWDHWVQELPPVATNRVELNERLGFDLWRQAARTEAAGGDASYEWAVTYKRFIHPLCAGLLMVVVAPLGLRWSPGLSVSAVGLGYVASVRIGDALVPAIGALGGSSIGLLFCVLVGALCWLTWREA